MKLKIQTLSLMLAGTMLGGSLSADKALIEALADEGVLSQEKASELLAKSQTVRPAGGNIKDLQIRGRVQAQAAYVDASNDVGDDDYSTFEMRRVRLGARATLFQNVRGQLEANLVPGSDLSMRTAFIEWREHKPAYIKLGYDKPRFGFEENTSSASILTVERTLINNTVAPGPTTGLSLNGGVEMIDYSAGVFTDRANRNADGNHDYMLNASVTLKLDDMVGQPFRLRADYLGSEDEGGNFGFDNGFSVSGHVASGPFDLRAEYLYVEDFDGVSTDGWYIMPSYYITEKLQGVVRYEMASSDNERGLRAASRYARRVNGLSSFDEDGDPVSGDTRGADYWALYAGLNYYFAGDFNKVMFGVEFSELETQTAGDLEATTLYGAWRILF